MKTRSREKKKEVLNKKDDLFLWIQKIFKIHNPVLFCNRSKLNNSGRYREP